MSDASRTLMQAIFDASIQCVDRPGQINMDKLPAKVLAELLEPRYRWALTEVLNEPTNA